jgi:hypothetical protein
VKTVKALLTYDPDTGTTLRREQVEIMFASGEPHPRDRVICIELPQENGKGRAVYIGLKTLAKATGLIVREPKRGRRR